MTTNLNEVTRTGAAGAGLAPVAGIHHVTAITADPQGNIDFYTKTLGLRLVKVTINYDDPGTYHFYFGDGLGRPGTIMTHFAWPGARRGTEGVGQVVETAFAIPAGSAGYWVQRLKEKLVPGVELTQRFGAAVVVLRDVDAMQLALVETPEAARAEKHAWKHADVPAEHAIRGFSGVTLLELAETAPAGILVDKFGYRETACEGKRVRYEATGDAVARVVDVVTTDQRQFARMGAGQVHHVAFRVPGDAEQLKWLELLRNAGSNVSPVMDRDYFHSIYFREPGGVLFEMATDGPGMTVNEPAEALGTKVQLPAWLEDQRAELEKILPAVRLAERVEGVGKEEV